jgi:predicted Rossmann fold flavoprotein
MSKKTDVIVIGGGASGMMAAIAAAEACAKVAILEKNSRLGEKLRITGGGRCNIWNEEHDERLLLANYGSNGDKGKFLFSSFARFGLDETIQFFSRIGIKAKIEARNRAFPISERAEDVADAMVHRIKELSIDVHYRVEVIKLNKKNRRIESLQTSDGILTADQYILATGGASKPETGSTGDGFRFLKEIGHNIASPTPTITPLRVKEDWIKHLAGTPIKDARITFSLNGKKAFRVEGDVLCTHFGMSGPLILNSAHKVAELLPQGPVMAHIDLYPSMDERQLDVFILQQLSTHGAKQLSNTIRYIVPDGMSVGLKDLLGSMDLTMNTGELTKEQRLFIARTIKAMPLTIDSLMGFEKAVIADGGIDIQDVDTKTMRSLLFDNLYVTGDLLHINRATGGYSLQLCWTTGYLAGISAAEN